MMPPGRTCGAQRCRTNPVEADFGKADLPARFISRSASMALMSEADAGTLSNSECFEEGGRPAPNAGIALAENLVGVKLLWPRQCLRLGNA